MKIHRCGDNAVNDNELAQLGRILAAARAVLPNLRPLKEWREDGVYQCRFCHAIGRIGAIKHKDCAAEEFVAAVKAMNS